MEAYNLAGSTRHKPYSPVRLFIAVLILFVSVSGVCAGESYETEVVGFTLAGKSKWERLRIQDLDIILDRTGKRYLPLLRLLDTLRVEKTVSGSLISFRAEGAPEVALDYYKKEIVINGKTGPMDLLVEISEISLEEEIYVLPEIISAAFSLDMEWDNNNYEFTAHAGRSLSILQVPKGESLFAIRTQEIVYKLPVARNEAYPNFDGLDFMQVQIRSGFTWDGGSSELEGRVDTLRQTLWGSYRGGAYKMILSQPNLKWDRSGPVAGSSPTVMMNWGQWKYRAGDYETAVGDSVFGLNDLAFPLVRMSGLRINGIRGLSRGEKGIDASQFGLRDYFIRSYVFEGFEETGSSVELSINDRVVGSQEVTSDRNAPAGMGAYSFRDIMLSPGTLNEIILIITDSNGHRTRIEKKILSTSILLPEGRTAFSGGIGTNRQQSDWETRGAWGGGRVLYGVNDRLTLGLTAAFQSGFYEYSSESFAETGKRSFPEFSTHLAGQIDILPFEYMIVSGDFAESVQNTGDEVLQGSAYRIRADLFPAQMAHLHGELFGYGENFFNGQNLDLRDRRGYFLKCDLTPHQKWSVDYGIGQVSGNSGPDTEEALTVDFQSLEIISKALPFTNLTAGVDTFAPNWSDSPSVLYYVKVLVHPMADMYFDGSVSFGDDLRLQEHPEFLSGLRLQDISSYQSASASATLMKSFKGNQGIGLAYAENSVRKKVSVIHSLQSRPDRPVQLWTEMGYRMEEASTFIDSRIEYFLDRSGGKRIELRNQVEEGNWTASMFINFSDLFSFNRKSLTRVPDGLINPDRGGVHGSVFLDYNANSVMDEDEPGIGEIKVRLEDDQFAITDENGYFILPGTSRAEKMSVFLDINSIPAVYSPTLGFQTATVDGGKLTEVNFGITPVASISGFIYYRPTEDTRKPMTGLRVYLMEAASGKFVTDSVTAGDGSYFFSDIKPGKYALHVDPRTIPPGYLLHERNVEIEIPPAKEPGEFTLQDIEAEYQMKQVQR